MPSFTTALCASALPRLEASKARRIASMSSHRSCPSSVEHVPSVIESPNATIAPVDIEERTSTDFTQNVEVVVAVNGTAVSSACLVARAICREVRCHLCRAVLTRTDVGVGDVQAHRQVLLRHHAKRHRIAGDAAAGRHGHVRGRVEEDLSIRIRRQRSALNPQTDI